MSVVDAATRSRATPPGRPHRRRRRRGPTGWSRPRARSPSRPTSPIDGAVVGRDAALAAPVRPHRVDRHVGGVGDRRRRRPCITADDVPGKPTYGLIAPDQPVFATRGRALRRRAGRRRRRRPPRDVPAGARRHRRRVRGARPAARSRGGDRRDARPDPPRRQRAAPPAHRARRRRRHRRRGRRGAPTRSGMQDQAFLGLEAALAVPDPGGGGVELHIATQWLHEDRKQIAACLGLPEDRGAARARRRRRGVRRPRGHQPAGPHLPARAAPGPAGAHGLQPVPRASSATSTAIRRRSGCATTPPATARSSRSRPASCSTAGPTRRRRRPCSLNADHPHPGAVPVPQRRRRRLRRAHQPPAVRGHARLRRGAGVLRPRGADGPAGRGVRARSGRDPAAQRDGHRRPR